MTSLGRFALLLGAFSFVGVFGTILPAELAELRVGGQVLFGIPVAAVTLLRLRRRPTILDGAVVAVLLLFLLAAVLSRDVQGSLEMLAGALAWGLLFWLMLDLRSDAARSAVAMGVVGALTAWLAVFAVRWIGEKVVWVSNGGGMPNLAESTQTLFWLTTNVVPVLTLLGVGFLGYLPRGAASRVLTIAFIAASVITVPLSGGRAAWLGILVAAVAWAVLARGRRLVPRVGPRSIAAALAVAAAAVVLFVALGERAVDAAGLGARLPLWREALSIFASDPLTGGGPGTYSWLRLEHVAEHQVPVDAVLAHNVVLQTLADGGLALFLGMALVIGAVTRVAWRRRSTMTPRELRIAAILIGFAAMSLLDDHSSLPAIAAMVVTLAAWLVTPSEADTPAPAPSRVSTGRGPALALPAAAVVLALVSMPAVALVDTARLHAQAGRAAMRDGDHASALEAFDLAIAAYPARPNYHLSAGMALALDGRPGEAVTHYRAAAELAPADARAWAAIAALDTSPDDALAAARRAAAAPTGNPRYQFLLATALPAGPEADVALARAVARNPGLATELAGNDGATTYLLDHLDTLAAEARRDPTQLRADLAVAGVTRAADLAPPWPVVAALAEGDTDDARAALASARDAEPFDVRTWQAAIALARFECDEASRRSAAVLADLSPGGRARTPEGLVYRTADLLYREAGIAGYQPVASPFDVLALEWPNAFVDYPECDS